jgi:putative CocE/NonD family hydrolase
MTDQKLKFIPKTPEERSAFLRKAEQDKHQIDIEERRLRKEILPITNYPFETPVTHHEIVIDRVMAPMRDGVALRTQIYRPKKEGKYPVILMRGPYDMLGSLDMAPALLRHLARRGYVGITQDVRGRFGSEGDFEPGINEHDDTFDAIEWAAAQIWSNGKVGMTGVSYLGLTSFCGAMANAPSLKAIMPVCINYGFEVLTGVPPLSGMAAWMIWAGQSTPTLQNHLRIDWLHLPLNEIGIVAGLPHPHFDAQVTERHDIPIILTGEEIERRLEKINIPTYIVAGWYDNFNEDMLLNYERQSRVSSDIRLIVGPWHHNLADLTQPHIGKVATTDVYLNRYYHEMERFFGHYLKEERAWNPPGPVLIYVLGSNQWRYEQEWPLKRAEYQSIYLGSDGKAAENLENGTLNWSDPAGKANFDSYNYNPLDPVRPIEGLNIWHLCNHLHDRTSVESRNDVLVYSTPVIEEDMEVTGTIKATLFASSSAPDTDFIITLVDVYPDGHTQYLVNGIVRATYREGFGERKLIEPGKIYKYEFKLQPISINFQKGHRMRIEITSSDMDRYARNQNVADAPGTTANVAIAHQRIFHSVDYPSKLDLPLIKSNK